MSARELIAKQIEPQAWAALGVGDTLAYRNRRVSTERKAGRICAALTAAGYVILSPDEVRGIRDEPVAWTEQRLRDHAKAKGWYTREGTSVPNVIDGSWRHPFSVTVDSRDFVDLLNATRPAEQAVTEAAQFDRADWYWRVMDPDDSGDTPEQAIHGSMLGDLVVCEIASSFTGPTRFGFIAPVLDDDSDDTEFLHFATEQEAIEAAKARSAALKALEARDATD